MLLTMQWLTSSDLWYLRMHGCIIFTIVAPRTCYLPAKVSNLSILWRCTGQAHHN